MDEEKAFKAQSEIMLQAVELFNDSVNRIEDEGRSTRVAEKSESEMEIVINIFKVRSLKLYRDTLKYLTSEVTRPEPEKHPFLLPNVRTLLDIYRRFLHLQINCRDREQQGLCCLAYQLLISRTLNREDKYKHVLSVHDSFLKKANFSFPERLGDFSFGWIDKKGLAFGKTGDLLKEENINRTSPDASAVFGAKKTVEIYSYFSEALHGNPWQYLGKTHNERFWVVSMSLSTSAFLLELVDRYTFRREHPKSFRLWLNNVKQSKNEFLALWKSKNLGRGAKTT